jgi:hypothetical protein
MKITGRKLYSYLKILKKKSCEISSIFVGRENETAYFQQWLPAMQIAFDGQQKQQNFTCTCRQFVYRTHNIGINLIKRWKHLIFTSGEKQDYN